MNLTAIVIDDSSLQRIATSKLIERHPNLKLIGTFDDPKKGLEAVNKYQPDVLFLDIEMPELCGFGVLEQLECDCQVILNSTRASFAIRAIQYHQVKDFLMKPMDKNRFEKSVDMAVENAILGQLLQQQHNQDLWSQNLSKAS